MAKIAGILLGVTVLCIGSVVSVSVNRALKDVTAFINKETNNPAHVAEKRSDVTEDDVIREDRILIGKPEGGTEPSDRPDKIKVTIFKEYKVQKPEGSYVSIQEQGGDFKGSLNPPPIREFIEQHTEQFGQNEEIPQELKGLEPGYELLPAVSPLIPAFQQQLQQIMNAAERPQLPPRVRFPQEESQEQFQKQKEQTKEQQQFIIGQQFPEPKQQYTDPQQFLDQQFKQQQQFIKEQQFKEQQYNEQEQYQQEIQNLDPLFDKYKRKTMDGWVPIKGSGLSSFYKDSFRGKGTFSPVKNVDFALEASASQIVPAVLQAPQLERFTQSEVLHPGGQVIQTQVKNLVINSNAQRMRLQNQRFPVYHPGTPMKVEIHAHNVILKSDQDQNQAQTASVSARKTATVSQIKAYESTPQVTAAIREHFRLSKVPNPLLGLGGQFPAGGLSLRSVAQAIRNGAFSRENDVVPQPAEQEMQISIPHTFKIRNPSVKGGYSTVSTQGLAALAKPQEQDSVGHQSTNVPVELSALPPSIWQQQGQGLSGQSQYAAYDSGQGSGGYDGSLGQLSGGYGGGQGQGSSSGGYGGGESKPTPKSPKQSDYGDSVKYLDKTPIQIVEALPAADDGLSSSILGGHSSGGYSGAKGGLGGDRKRLISELQQKLNRLIEEHMNTESKGQYGPPGHQSYGPPAASSASYGVPGVSYGAPLGPNGASSGSYGAPSGSYGAPSGSYGAPAASSAYRAPGGHSSHSHGSEGGYSTGGSGGLAIDIDSDSYGMKYHLSPPESSSHDDHVDHGHGYGHGDGSGHSHGSGHHGHVEEDQPILEISDHGPGAKESLVKLGKNLFYTALDFSRKYNPITFIEKVKEFPPVRFEVHGQPSHEDHGHGHDHHDDDHDHKGGPTHGEKGGYKKKRRNTNAKNKRS